ncbi:hypothetical protein GCK72_018934 [Caenorhabditis remanei]|uniref:T20D4.11-like domain-containing protein n=1 Tax=Caenorhabditis remanei TaxID=31234 RepID=E3M059_CAERE|nr:hypothetical protein GCK72_018934 [Caenorhabditis remanei]EFO87713.1 hypothetical protein CRE_05594 [Caenorhabditis remanei]KAF1752379.1 hypothetical protein GCK72_018934 [Caenorhabditis remanei]
MILLTIFLIGSVFGYDESKCNPSDLPIAMKCILNHREIREQAVSLDLNDNKNVVKLNNICIEFLKCAVPMKCGGEGKDVENIDKAISYCDAVAFHVSAEYSVCAEIVDTKNSTCVQGWNPFPDIEDSPAEQEKRQKEACENFFGKDGCLEQEITDNCSLETWKNFKKHYLALNKIIEACDFE